ncbi:MAG: DUF4263 domain-containing protein [Longibaculum muris]|uniref:Shedu anti-phage system protein SduA domain-containing protein n=1 Tax=Longibaculum muris TaxID=1796628 RepID=UPI002E7A5763|nr:Shedu anti-phage system protein SduA domain-containing protein [Longibaculum muris]MED9811610.1 DUF4263 domain-containing protein [Longibaculum muris]
MKLYQRDYCKGPTKFEMEEYERIREEEKIGMGLCRRNLYPQYPEAIRHYNSLFPNNHIELFDWKASGKMSELTKAFEQLVHDNTSRERDILNFINHTPAPYIIGSLLIYKDFGHHDTFIFPEFSIGAGTYFADYLIVGKNSGGYEFLFVELEAPHKSTTIKSGYEGYATRSGLNQISDWKYQIETDFVSITKEFEKACIDVDRLPQEFRQYDSTRMHYVVIAGLRDDYNDVTYRTRREKIKYLGIEMYHYDNLIDFSKALEEKNTF